MHAAIPRCAVIHAHAQLVTSPDEARHASFQSPEHASLHPQAMRMRIPSSGCSQKDRCHTCSRPSASSRSTTASSRRFACRSRYTTAPNTTIAARLIAKFWSVSVRSGAFGAPPMTAMSFAVMIARPTDAPAPRPPAMMVRVSRKGALASARRVWRVALGRDPASWSWTSSHSRRSRSDRRSLSCVQGLY
jgi:hypothetical protein